MHQGEGVFVQSMAQRKGVWCTNVTECDDEGVGGSKMALLT